VLSGLHTGSGSSPLSSTVTQSSSNSNSSDSILSLLLQEGASLLSTERDSLLTCRPDSSLMTAWQAAQATDITTNHTSSSSGSSSSSTPAKQQRYLLAANFHNSAAVLPSFLLQVLRLALLLPQGHLAISVYESGSSDTSRVWLSLLHHLLLPLQLQHNITLGGSLSPRQHLQRIQLLAALRNAAIEPWLTPPPQPQQQQQQQHQQQQRDAGERQGHGHAAGVSASSAAGSVELSYRLPGQWEPDVIVYANDVFLCVEDILRLSLHGAHIACGMDFYDAPWMAPAAAAAAAADAHGGKGAAGAAAGHQQGTANSSSSSSSMLLLTGPEVDDDFFDPSTGQLMPISSSQNSSSIFAGTLRFYDKVRDRLFIRSSDGAQVFVAAPVSPQHVALMQHVVQHTLHWASTHLTLV